MNGAGAQVMSKRSKPNDLTATVTISRRGKPNDLKLVYNEYMRPRDGLASVHDRRTADQLHGARLVAVEVDDPDPINFGDKLIVMRSTRDDPLADMRARDVIDAAQYLGGRHWQAAHENSQIGSVKAIDFTKEAVDGGGGPREMLTDRQRRGAQDINAARDELKEELHALVYDCLARCLSIRQAAFERGRTSGRAQMKLSADFQGALTRLSYRYGYATRPKG